MTETFAAPTDTADLRARPGAGAQLSEQITEAAGRRGRSRNVRPLLRLLPYAMRHKGHLVVATLWLLVSTAASLGLTATARGAIDNGFRDGGTQLNFWFLVLGANAFLLGLATAARYFYVTKTGERVIADLRKGRSCIAIDWRL